MAPPRGLDLMTRYRGKWLFFFFIFFLLPLLHLHYQLHISSQNSNKIRKKIQKIILYWKTTTIPSISSSSSSSSFHSHFFYSLTKTTTINSQWQKRLRWLIDEITWPNLEFEKIIHATPTISFHFLIYHKYLNFPYLKLLKRRRRSNPSSPTWSTPTSCSSFPSSQTHIWCCDFYFWVTNKQQQQQ